MPLRNPGASPWEQNVSGAARVRSRRTVVKKHPSRAGRFRFDQDLRPWSASFTESLDYLTSSSDGTRNCSTVTELQFFVLAR
jgi:hypothetical protein